MKNQSALVVVLLCCLLVLSCFTFIACEKPAEAAKRIAETPRYELTDLTVSKDGHNFIVCTEQGTVNCTDEWIVIKYDSTITKPLVKNYSWGDGCRTELIFKNRNDYLQYLEMKTKVLNKKG